MELFRTFSRASSYVVFVCPVVVVFVLVLVFALEVLCGLAWTSRAQRLQFVFPRGASALAVHVLPALVRVFVCLFVCLFVRLFVL